MLSGDKEQLTAEKRAKQKVAQIRWETIEEATSVKSNLKKLHYINLIVSDIKKNFCEWSNNNFICS